MPCAASPPETGHTPLGSYGQASGAAANRYSSKFSVVPDSSERFTGVMLVLGSSTSGLSSAMAGSSQVVTCWLKMLAISVASMFSESMPGRLNATATGEM